MRIFVAIFFALPQPDVELFRLYGGATRSECNAFIADLFQRHRKVNHVPRKIGAKCEAE